MSIVHRLEACAWQVNAGTVQTPDGRETPIRELAIMHPGSDQVWVIPLPLNVAEDMGGQLKGEPPRKHVEVVGAGALAPHAIQQMPNGRGRG